MIQLDHRSRRRSLSRTHIEYMFDWSDDMRDTVDPRSASVRDKPLQHRRRKRQFAIPCANCAEASHRTADCIAPCGHCGAPNPHRGLKRARADWAEAIPSYKLRVHQNPHIASQCPVAPRNRCKCVPFPTFHTAARCGIPCRRDCGGQIFNKQHPNAMNCRSRCCMCGLRGHSGRECRLRRCRCGGAHLGQDCSWNPTCRVPGCDRFHCGIHCRECGSTEKPFIGFRCTKCLGFEESPRELSEQGKGRRRRARKRANNREPEGEEEEKRGCNDENGPPIKDETASPTATTAFTPSSPIVLPPTGNEKQVKSIFSDPRQAKDPGRVNR
ncbi:hypothetical protein N656DRAFT_799647 [Canariomyces notabilis]|uniref:Uncharacterized protein n=1 Tax=Canariomyces notabilis TaxID=2074819 RepID=A0AAN6QMN3_9PEZI|nr:hypothetical protein N656DRAFT_799647 [Canariomyces arenarius]